MIYSCDTIRIANKTGFPRGIESIEKVLYLKIGLQDLEKY